MYKDPLHVPSANLVVWHKGKETLMLNKRLLDQQNCWTNLEAIKACHSEKLHIYDEMNETDDTGLLMLFDALLTQIEYELQGLWGFPLDIKYHRFWERPKCTCPKLDNADWYPVRQVISGDCPLHG